MVGVPREEREKLYSRFRELLFNGNSIETICQLLNIKRSTYFKYKKKLIKDVIRDYKPNPEEQSYRRSMVIRSLEECHRVNTEIMLNPKASPHERTTASEMQVAAAAQLKKFADEGYIERPQLGNIKVIPLENNSQ